MNILHTLKTFKWELQRNWRFLAEAILFIIAVWRADQVRNIIWTNVKGKKCVWTQRSTEEVRKAKLAGIFQRKEKFNLSSSWNAGNGCCLHPEDPCCLMSQAPPLSCRIYVLLIAESFLLKLWALFLGHKNHLCERCHQYFTISEVTLLLCWGKPLCFPQSFSLDSYLEHCF